MQTLIKPYNFRVLIHKIFQKINHLSKHLKIKTRFTICKNIRLSNSNSNVLAKGKHMTVIYLRVTHFGMLPEYVYWILKQEAHLGFLPKLANKEYLGAMKLLHHYVYTSIGYVPISKICDVVLEEDQANFSIGKVPQNFGEVTLLNTNRITYP